MEDNEEEKFYIEEEVKGLDLDSNNNEEMKKLKWRQSICKVFL